MNELLKKVKQGLLTDLLTSCGLELQYAKAYETLCRAELVEREMKEHYPSRVAVTEEEN